MTYIALEMENLELVIPLLIQMHMQMQIAKGGGGLSLINDTRQEVHEGKSWRRDEHNPKSEDHGSRKHGVRAS